MTIYGSEELNAKLSRQCRRYTDPLFLQDHFFGPGHDDGAHNGTDTFIKYCGHHYVCTCQHVAESLGNEAIMGTETKHPTASRDGGQFLRELPLCYLTSTMVCADLASERATA